MRVMNHEKRRKEEEEEEDAFEIYELDICFDDE